MNYHQIKDLADDAFRRLTGIKRSIFEKIVWLLRKRISKKSRKEAGKTNCL